MVQLTFGLEALTIITVLAGLAGFMLGRRSLRPPTAHTPRPPDASTQQIQALMHTANHDIKTPLAVMNTSIYLLQQEYGKNPYLQMMEEQTNALTHRLQQTLTLLRLLLLKNLQYQPCNLNTLINEATAQKQPIAQKRGLTLNCQLPTKPIYASVNSDELLIMLQQLLDNALQYTVAPGQITVSLQQDTGDMVRINVTDTGVGMPEEECTSIFEQNFRGNGGRELHENGIGLGLAIVERIVTLHHGSVSVSSQAGTGSTFTLLLPVQPKQD